MKNRSLILLLTLALSAASAQSASTGSAVSTDARLSKATVTFKIVRDGTGLMALLTAIAKSAGYELILDPALDSLITPGVGNGSGTVSSDTATPQAPQPGASSTLLTYDFVGKPFNQVWPFLMDVYGLNYEVVKLGSSEVLRVGKNPIQRILLLPKTLDAALVEQRVKLAFGTRQTTSQSQSTTAASGNQTNSAPATTTVSDIVLDSATLKIVGEPTSNSLIVRGNNQEVAQVEALVNQIIASQPPELAKAVVPIIPVIQFIYSVKGAQADAAALLKDQYPAITVTSVGQTGQLVLSGQKTQIDAALALLGQVDKPLPLPVTVQAAPDVQQIYTAKGKPEDVSALLTAQFPALKVTPVGSTGQLVLSGQKSQLDTALALLGQVDKAPSVQANPDVRQQVYAVKGDQKDIAALLSVQFPALKVTPVGTTGQLVLNGTQDQLDAATALLGSVDKAVASGPDVQQKVFQLVNASAEELKAVLDNTLQTALTTPTNDASALPNVPVNAVDANGNSTVVSVPNAAANAQATATKPATTPQNPNAATIIADKRTNTLIVRGTAAQVEQVAALIPSLDQVVPQINVQVRIQEITEDAARTLGLNWKVGFGGFNISSGATGLAASFDPTRALVGGFNLLPTLNALETQTQTKRIYDGSITMQSGQRSLGTVGGGGTTNASSNAAATIKSGGRLELNIPSASGNITKQIDYGINLDFFDPQVAPDGTITLRVRGQINQPKTAITGTSLPNILDFSNSEAQSIVTFKSGQTLLLSGLLGTNETSTNRGVPFLSSLPVVGAAFGQKETSKTQSQLMVVITGTIVK